MNCADLEALICDYVDGTLRAPERELVERHLAACAACRELAGDAAAAVRFIERAGAVEPPPELVTRILFQIPTREQARAQRLAGISGWLGRMVRPILQPRFAMGMAMTILSLSMLGKFAGITPRQLSPADLHPAKVWQAMDDRLHRGWERARKFYQSLRVVYEIQSQLRDWTAQEEEDRGETGGGAELGAPAGGESGGRPATPGAEQALGKSR